MDRPTRERKQVEAINISSVVKKDVVNVGKGTELSSMPQVVTNVSKFTGSDDELKKIHVMFYKRVGKKIEIKRNILMFKGYDPTLSKEEVVEDVFSRCGRWQKGFITKIMDILTVDRSSKTGDVSKDGLLERLAVWCMEPSLTSKKASSTGSKKRKKASTTTTKAASSAGSPKKKKAKTFTKKAPVATNEDDSSEDEDDVPIEHLKERIEVAKYAKEIIGAANMDELTLKQLRKQIEKKMGGKKMKHHSGYMKELVLASST